MAGEAPDPVWLRVLNSGTMATLITVVLGGILGNILLSQWERGAKEREQVRAVAKETLDAGMTQVDRAFGEAGSVISATENLEAVLSDPIWSPKAQVPPDRAQRIAAKRREIVEAFDSALVTWQKEREQIALKVTYLMATPANDPGDDWRRVQGAVDAYITCVKTCNSDRETNEVYESCGCDSVKDSAWVSLRTFAKTLPHAMELNAAR